jgi:hypothetical protein
MRSCRESEAAQGQAVDEIKYLDIFARIASVRRYYCRLCSTVKAVTLKLCVLHSIAMAQTLVEHGISKVKSRRIFWDMKHGSCRDRIWSS